MKRAASADGYAMLAALVVMVLAATFALVVVGAVHGLQLVEGADASGWRAGAAEARALAQVTRALRWHASLAGGSASGGECGTDWSVSWEPALPAAGQLWPGELARVRTSSGSATSRDDAVLELRAEPWAMGVTCTGDAEIDAPLTVSGSGVYLGGCLRGRENVSFGDAAGSGAAAAMAPDCVRGDVYPSAAVHGGAGIFAVGVEIHDPTATSRFDGDTDVHTGLAVDPAWVNGPSTEFLLAAQAEATPPGPALVDGLLRLDLLSPASGQATVGGRCILLPDLESIAIEGTPSPGAGRVLLVVRGDAVLGRPGATTVLSGGLIVCGHLEIRGRLQLEGTLHAGSLAVEAPACVVVAADWRASPLAGATVPTLVEHGG
jgi:hypothetical protein